MEPYDDLNSNGQYDTGEPMLDDRDADGEWDYGLLELDGDVYTGTPNAESATGFEGLGGVIRANSITVQKEACIRANDLGFDSGYGPGAAPGRGGTHGGKGGARPSGCR